MDKGEIRKITRKELLEYDNQVKRRAKRFRLTPTDFHNLYDLFWMANKDLWKTLKINKMDKWFHNFTYGVERILFTEDLALNKVKQ